MAAMRLELMRPRVLLLVLVAGCSHSVEDDLAALRAEITQLENEVPPEAPLWISEGPNAFDRHLEDFSPGVPDFIYNHVAKKLAAMKNEEIASQSQGLLSPDAVFKNAPAHRGKFWTIRGTIANLEPQPVADRGLGRTTMYSGVLFMEGRPVLFHVVDKPDVAFIGQDVMEAHAIFLKVVSYTARNGRKVDAPFLLARRLGKYY
jgi:hypothetical protein